MCFLHFIDRFPPFFPYETFHTWIRLTWSGRTWISRNIHDCNLIWIRATLVWILVFFPSFQTGFDFLLIVFPYFFPYETFQSWIRLIQEEPGLAGLFTTATWFEYGPLLSLKNSWFLDYFFQLKIKTYGLCWNGPFGASLVNYFTQSVG